mgnify:CR=1 FL=1
MKCFMCGKQIDESYFKATSDSPIFNETFGWLYGCEECFKHMQWYNEHKEEVHQKVKEEQLRRIRRGEAY